MKPFFLYIHILFLSFSCLAQEGDPLHFQFTIENGLPSNRIYDIMQDNKGYLWIGTHNGLVRFNGKEFKEFSTIESLNSEYSYLHELKDGSIWCINFGNQVFKVDGDSLKVVEAFKPYFNDRKYFSLHQRKDSILYLKTKDRIASYDPFENKVSEIVSKNENIREVDNLSVDSSHLFYSITLLKDNVFTREDYFYEADNGEPKKKIRSSPTQLIKKIKSFSSSNHIYIHEFPLSKSGEEITYTLQGNNTINTIDTLIASQKSKWINSISRINSDETWISTRSGSINLKRGETIFKEESITRIIKDHEDNYWISSYDSGLFLIPNIYVSSFKETNNSIIKIEQVNDSLIALGSSEGNIHIFNINKNVIVNSIFVTKNNIDKFILIDNNKNLLLPESYTIANLRNTYPFSKVVERNDYLKKQCYLNDEKSSILILDGFNRISIIGDKVKKVELSDFWEERPIRSSFSKNHMLILNEEISMKMGNLKNIHYEKHNNRIWIISDNKTYIEHKKEFKEFKGINGKSLKINCILSKENNVIAAERDYGLVFIENENVLFEKRDEKYEEFGAIRKIIHAEDFLVSLAKKGIIVSNDKGEIIYTLDETDGFKGSTVNDIFYTEKKLWIGISKGLFHLPIEKIKDNNSPPLVYITQLFANNSEKNIDIEKNIFPNKSDIEIFFNGISYKGKKNAFYKYRINENSEWRSLSYNSNSILFPNLSSGNYSFQIRMINEEGIEGKVSSIHFKIRSPIWLRWWFILGSLAIISSIVYYFYQAKLKRVEQENKWQQEIRANKLSALQSRMNPHFIFNALNSIQDFIIKLDKMGANEYLGVFSDLMRIYLTQSEKEEIELQEEIEALRLYLKLEKLRFGDIDIHFHVDQALNNMDIFIPPLFIQPYVENAFKHGLLHKTDKGKEINIDFKFIQNENLLKIIVKDNGVGRKKVLEIQEKSNTMKGLSYSTKANKTRLELLNHNRTGKIQVNTIDLLDNNTPTGTKVIITIPIN